MQSFRKTPYRRRGPNRCPRRQIAASARHGFPRPVRCRNNVSRFHPTSTAMFRAQPTGMPQMLRDVGLARSVDRPQDAGARGLPQFPVILDLKRGTERYCVLSGITAGGHFTQCTPMSNPHVRRAIASTAEKPRRNPVLERDTVIMLAKICGL